MMITKFRKFVLNEDISLDDHDGILIIVDVQSNFKKYFPNDPNSYLKKLNNYCEEFPKDGIKGVYQVWDSNNGSKPTYNFTNQVDLLEKKYGVKKFYSKYKGGFNEWVKYIFDDETLNQYLSKKGVFNEGDAFKIKDSNEFLIYIGNNHNWFYVNEELVDFFKKLKGKSVIVCGGADSECLEDLYVALKSFNVNPVYNYKYVYSAETGNPKLK